MWRLLRKLILLCYQLINKGTKIQSYCGVEVSYFSWCCSIPVYFADCEWKAQAGNPCAASFDWSCSGICKSVERMAEVHERCGEGDGAVWVANFWISNLYPFIVSSAVVIYTVVKLYWASPPPNFHMLKWVMCGSVITVMSWILQFFFYRKIHQQKPMALSFVFPLRSFFKKRQWILGNDVWQY